MSHRTFNIGDLGISSALQLTLWRGRLELRELTAEAVTAFGTDDQAYSLRALGHDFVQYLGFKSTDLESADYPQLSGFKITHSVLSKCTETGRRIEKRSVRILTATRNGPVLRGFGESEHSHTK